MPLIGEFSVACGIDSVLDDSWRAASLHCADGLKLNRFDSIAGIKKLESQNWLSSNSNGSSSINTAIATVFCLGKRLFSLRSYPAKL